MQFLPQIPTSNTAVLGTKPSIQESLGDIQDLNPNTCNIGRDIALLTRSCWKARAESLARASHTQPFLTLLACLSGRLCAIRKIIRTSLKYASSDLYLQRNFLHPFPYMPSGASAPGPSLFHSPFSLPFPTLPSEVVSVRLCG